jgi:glycerate kinase
MRPSSRRWRSSLRALACPASLKGVLAPVDAAAALAEGVRRVEGWECDELPVADGGEGTAEVVARIVGGEWQETVASDPLGRPVGARWLLLPDRIALVESAEAVGLGLLAESERDPLVASSAGLGRLLLSVIHAGPTAVLVGVGGTATVDGGAGLREILPRWPEELPLRVLCDVRNPLLGPRGAARVFAPQKGAGPEAVGELEQRLAAMEELRPFRALPGAGAGGGLGAALAALGGELTEGAEVVLQLTGFDHLARGAAFAVTGEGTVDQTTLEGKAPGAVLRHCRNLGVECVLFGGRVAPHVGVEARALSGDRRRAREDLTALGEELARAFGRR